MVAIWDRRRGMTFPRIIYQHHQVTLQVTKSLGWHCRQPLIITVLVPFLQPVSFSLSRFWRTPSIVFFFGVLLGLIPIGFYLINAICFFCFYCVPKPLISMIHYVACFIRYFGDLPYFRNSSSMPSIYCNVV